MNLIAFPVHWKVSVSVSVRREKHNSVKHASVSWITSTNKE